VVSGSTLERQPGEHLDALQTLVYRVAVPLDRSNLLEKEAGISSIILPART